MINPTNITFLVLCGGAGTRMNGADKPLMKWQGRPMLDRVVDSVPPDMPKLISANRNLDEYAKRGSVITDSETPYEHATPLVGIYAGLCRAQTDWLLIAPGDTPLLTSDWWLPLTAIAQEQAIAAVIHDGTRQQHLHVLLHRGSRDSLARYLSRGKYAVGQWLEELGASPILSDNSAQFQNVNYACELKS